MTSTAVRVGRVVLVVLAVAYLSWVVTGWNGGVRVQGDALVYRAGARAWLDGAPVYRHPLPLEFSAGEMSFTYGPLALVVFAPLTELPAAASFAVLAVASWLALWASMSLWCRAVGLVRHNMWWAGLVATGVASLSTPVLDHLRLGQVNCLLLLLASVDLLAARPRWPRGALLGIAIAVKLTPAALLLLPLLRKDLRTVVVAGATAAAGVAASWLIVPREATYFWFTAFRDPGRIGNLRSPENQSMRGVTERWIDGPLGGVTWLLLVACVVALVSWAVVRVMLPRGDRVGAAAMVFVLPALLSPVAWTHHWVWAFPLLVWLVARAAQGSVSAAVIAAAGIGTLVLFPIDSFDPLVLVPGSSAWSPLDAALAGGYVYWALVALGCCPWLASRRRETRSIEAVPA